MVPDMKVFLRAYAQDQAFVLRIRIVYEEKEKLLITLSKTLLLFAHIFLITYFLPAVFH